MTNIKKLIIRNRLGVTVSALAIAAACGVASRADAQTLVLPSGFNVVTVNSSLASQYKTIEISNGITGWIVPSWAAQTWAVGNNTALVLSSPGGAANISTLNPCQNGSLAYNKTKGSESCLGGAPLLQVDKGGTLILGGQQTNSSIVGGYGFENAIHADGDVVIQYAGPPQSWGTPTQQFIGTNSFLGNITMAQNATATFGLSWATANTAFGPNTNIILGSGSVLSLYQNPSTPLVMGGAISGTGTATLYSGTLIVNGQNTAANPFLGTLTINPGQTLVVGDASHSSAVFGDPGHPTAQTLSIKGTTAGSPVLRGFGTIDATVANVAGLVQPGDGSGTLGTLTVAAYTQDNVGTLKVEVNPTSVAGLHVLGNAALGGTLNVTIDPGSYTTKIYNIVQVDGTMTGDFKSITTSSTVAGAIAAVTKSSNGYQVVTEVVQGAAASAPIVVGHVVSANRLNNNYLVSSLYDAIAMPHTGAQVGPNKYAWIEGFGRHSSVSRNDVGYHTTTEGFTAGAEYRPAWHNATVGLAVSYSAEDLKAKGASTADINTWHVAAYGGADVQYMRLDGVLFYNGYSTDAKRDFGTTGVAKVSPDGYAYGGSLQISMPMFRGLLTPYLRGIISRQHLDASAETGASLLDLGYNAINANTFVGDFGFRIDPLRSYPESKTKLLVTVAVQHDFSALGEKVTGMFPVTAGQAWSAYWRGDSENTGIIGIDAARQITDKLEISGRVNGRASLYQTSGEVALNARYRF